MITRGRNGRTGRIACLVVAVICGLWHANSVSAQAIIVAKPTWVEDVQQKDGDSTESGKKRTIRPARPIVAWMPFDVKSVQVDVSVNETVATTKVEHVFVNRSASPIEGTYMFPLKASSAVHGLSMVMNGREVEAELLDAEKARGIYESIVAQMRDPALLEYAEGGLVRAKVFPIPPRGECKITLKYTEPMRMSGGMGCYRMSLCGGNEWNRPIGSFALRASLETARPLFNVFSPSHKCSIDRRQAKKAIVSFELSDVVSERDFELYFSTSDEPFGLSMLTHWQGGEDGFFMTRLSPRFADANVRALPKDICFVLDTSGSMAEDDKIEQAKRSLQFCISNLGKEDRFNVITFATEVQHYAEGWMSADDEHRAAAKAFIQDLRGVGGTNIDLAMEDALKLSRQGDGLPIAEVPSARPLFIVFITDGEPTVGLTEPQEILKNVKQRNEAVDARVFVLGVGFSVNTKLLDRLADDNGGAREYVTPREDLELKLSAFYTKLANPVLTNISIAFEGMKTFDVYPKTLPDLFKGAELVLMGRFAADVSGEPSVCVEGVVDGQTKKFVYRPGRLGKSSENDFLPRLWAMRKIGYLLDEMRLHGETAEVRDEVIRLSKRYGVMTPYTSYLVMEDEARAASDGQTMVGPSTANTSLQEVLKRNKPAYRDEWQGQRRTKGKTAVDASRYNTAMQQVAVEDSEVIMSDVAKFNVDEAGAALINQIGAKTFYRIGNRWVDAEYNEKDEPVKLVLYSTAFNDFLRDNGSAGVFFAQGSNVLLCWNGRVYETVPPDADEATTP